MKRVRCKLYVETIACFSDPRNTGSVKLRPVWESKPGVDGNVCAENHVFGKYTPTGEVNLTILNPEAFATFAEALQKGIPFYVDFTPVEGGDGA